jgi:hypothetical protein
MPATEAERRAAGYTTRKLRMRQADAEALDNVAAKMGLSLSATVAELARQANRKKKTRRA